MNPTTYTKAKADEICRQLSLGTPLTEICRGEGMPAVRTVSQWRKDNPEFEEAYRAARAEGFDAIAADCLRIADTPVDGIVEKLEMVEIANPDDPDAPPTTELQVTERRREDMLGHRKLQIDTRLKLLAKWDPQRYGDRMTLAGDKENPLAGMTEAQMDARLEEYLKGKGNADHAD